jgi:hypothetical protein
LRGGGTSILNISSLSIDMDAIGKELDANGTILDLGMQDAEQWAQNVQGCMRGLPKLGSMSEVEKNLNTLLNGPEGHISGGRMPQ